tara:strand:- start:138 stop:833 length:696 start_codon:yes stop_codon:yes gene_type:complete
MSEFLSLYDVVFGVRDTKGVGVETDDERFLSRHGIKYKVKSVDMAMAVCAIEDENCKSYCFDYFGRFGRAKAEAKEDAIALLADYQRVLLIDNPNDVDEYEEYLSDVDMTPDWHAFGWPADELPDFEACYKKWKLKHNPSGEEPTLRIKRQERPRKSNTVWGMVEGLIRMVITDHLLSESQSTDEFVAELMSKTNSTNTMKLFSKLQKLAPDSFAMDEATFRKQLKNIFGK